MTFSRFSCAFSTVICERQKTQVAHHKLTLQIQDQEVKKNQEKEMNEGKK